MGHEIREGYGRFGAIVSYYIKARKEFPDDVFDFLENSANGLKSKNILDLGCGTGISTKQLALRGALVIGIDVDQKMIEKAKTVTKTAEFHVAPVRNLPFQDSSFDIATAFSAFHWFCGPKEIDEIKRVIKPKGIFFVINKNCKGDFLKGYREILSKFIPELPNVKSNYEPDKFLKKHGFGIKKEYFLISEEYSFNHAVSYLQSVSLWNLVPKEKSSEALDLIKQYCRDILTNGKIVEKVEITVISGKNPC